MSEVRAAATGVGASDDDVIEEAVHRFVGLEVLDELRARNRVDEDEAMELTVSDLRAMPSESQAP